MNFKSGDKVRFLNEVGEGRIQGFQSENIAIVEMEDGFEIPMKLTELIKLESADETYQVNEGMKEAVSKKSNMPPDSKKIKFEKQEGIYFAVVKKSMDSYTLYIVNDSDYVLFYVISKQSEMHDELMNQGELEDNTKLIIGDYSFDEFKALEFVRFQFLFFGKHGFKFETPIEKTMNFKNISLLPASFLANDYFESKAIILKVENDDLSKELEKLSNSDLNAIIKIKEEKPKKVGDFLKKSHKKNANEAEEVDLHIESIVDDHSNMSAGEILNTQLSRFEVSLNGALRNNTRRIVFIHGIGNGKLKYELGKMLDRKYPDLKYQDASFKEYGYGATLVIIK